MTAISNGRCRDLENIFKVRLSTCKLLRSALAKVKSGLVPVFQLLEIKLGASLELYKGIRLPLAAQSTKYSPSGLVKSELLYMCGKVTSIEIGVCVNTGIAVGIRREIGGL